MDVKNINPVLKSFVTILKQLGFHNVERKSLSVEGSVLINTGCMVNVGVVGTLKGSIVIGMDVESAKKIASVMMMGMEIADFDAMAQSAVCEMTNMICANSCINFESTGTTGIDISPPTLLLGQGGRVRLATPNVIVIRHIIDSLEVTLYVGLYGT